ncbi:MAG TPA: LIM domain-containing protein [Gemmatimonadaceae bacterium]|nr:LIM domain-containing protein [Gemmatimonadaceae bacterium]
MTAPSDPGGLQFDKVSSGAAPSGMTCANCGKPITDTYYTVRDKPICEECKQKADAGIAAHFAKGRSSDAFGKAVLYGIGAGIAGAFVYFLVEVITKYELALVALAIGWAVGRAIQVAAKGVGGRRYQILAVVITYLSIGAAYGMIIMHDRPDSTVFEFIFATIAGPILVVVASGASGILSAIIIGVGLRTAWQMTAGAVSLIKGPFRVGAAPAAGAPRA